MISLRMTAVCAALIVSPAVVLAETNKETLECTFGKGLANRPTPEKVVFPVDEFGRSALLHEAEIPGIVTDTGSGRIRLDSPIKLSIASVGQTYLYAATGRTYAGNESRIDAIDLRDQEFSIALDCRTMKAITKSSTVSAYAARDGFAKGRCKAFGTPKS